MSSNRDSLADAIRVRLAEDATHSNSEHVLRCAATYSQALTAVLDEHQPQRIYGECGHTHVADEPGTVLVDEVGQVCEDGYLYTICGGCCCTEDGDQVLSCSEESDRHERDLLPCWPCGTVRVVARALGIDVPAGAR